MEQLEIIRWAKLQYAAVTDWGHGNNVYAVLCVSPVHVLSPINVINLSEKYFVLLNGVEVCISDRTEIPPQIPGTPPVVLQFQVQIRSLPQNAVLSPHRLYDALKRSFYTKMTTLLDTFSKIGISTVKIPSAGKKLHSEFQIIPSQPLDVSKEEQIKNVYDTLLNGARHVSSLQTTQMNLQADKTLMPPVLYTFKQDEHFNEKCMQEMAQLPDFRKYVNCIACKVGFPLEIVPDTTPKDGRIANARVENFHFTGLFVMAYTLYTGTLCKFPVKLHEYLFVVMHDNLETLKTEQEAVSDPFKVQPSEQSAVCQFLLRVFHFLQSHVFGGEFQHFKIVVPRSICPQSLVADDASVLEITKNVIDSNFQLQQFEIVLVPAVSEEHIRSLFCQSYLLLRTEQPVPSAELKKVWEEHVGTDQGLSVFEEAIQFFTSSLDKTHTLQIGN